MCACMGITAVCVVCGGNEWFETFAERGYYSSLDLDKDVGPIERFTIIGPSLSSG